MEFEAFEAHILIICAVRYAIGRCSVMPSTVVFDIILPRLHKLQDSTINCILDELKEREQFEEVKGKAVWGMDCDYDTWHYLWDKLKEERKRRDDEYFLQRRQSHGTP